MEGETAFAVTKTIADITATDNVVAVRSTQDFLDLDDIYIERELVRYTSKNGTAFLSVSRGREGTEAVVHAANATVKNESANIINNLLGFNVAATASTYGSVKAVVGLGWNLIGAIPRMIAWNYSFLDGQLAMIKYLILWPISIGFVWGLVSMFLVAIQSIFRR